VIAIGLILLLLALLGAPLFAIIATSAMLGFHREETDLMNMALEIQSIADLPFLGPYRCLLSLVISSVRARRRNAWCD